jgi:hypothetical protein
MRRLKTTKRRKDRQFKQVRNETEGLEDNQSWMVGTITDSETTNLPTGVTK